VSEREIFGRVLVALDASPHSLTALDAAADLASVFGADLLGIFVEDAALLRMAELPCACEVASFSGEIAALDAERLRLQLRAVAERARRALAACADRARVRWSFRVSRGPVPAAVMESLAGGDLISLGRLGGSRSARGRLGSTARTIVRQTTASALVVEREKRLGGPLCAVYDGSKAARRGLDAVARLARGQEPTVLVLAANEAGAERLEREAVERLRPAGVNARPRRLVGADRKTVLAAIAAAKPGLVVLPGDGEELATLLAPIESPVLVVRAAE
jgi:nucleotide-binding universal stress UspA family protein